MHKRFLLIKVISVIMTAVPTADSIHPKKLLTRVGKRVRLVTPLQGIITAYAAVTLYCLHNCVTFHKSHKRIRMLRGNRCIRLSSLLSLCTPPKWVHTHWLHWSEWPCSREVSNALSTEVVNMSGSLKSTAMAMAPETRRIIKVAVY